MLDRQLVEACLYNFLGYGNINGRYWFIGTEEGGAEIWRLGIGTKTHEESLSVRKSSMPSMDLRHVWEDCYGIPLEGFQGPTVWRYIAAFLIYAEGCPSDEEIRSKISCFLFKKKRLGTPNGNHFLGELYPLPKESKNSIKRYKDFWQTVQEYHTEVKDRRLDLFTTALKNSPNVRFIVSYEETASQLLRKHFAVADEIRKEVSHSTSTKGGISTDPRLRCRTDNLWSSYKPHSSGKAGFRTATSGRSCVMLRSRVGWPTGQPTVSAIMCWWVSLRSNHSRL